MQALKSGTVETIAPGVRRIVAPNPGVMTGYGTNTYLIGTNRFLVLDPGPAIDTHIERILDATQHRVEAVLVTHTHPDHSPAATSIAEQCRAPLLGRVPPADGRQDLTFMPDRVLAEGDVVTIEAHRLSAIHTPGHVSNHLCYLLEGSGLLFTGDHLNQGTTVVIVPPEGSMRDYLHSLAKLQRPDIERLAPGHGHIIEDAQTEIARIYQHRLTREAKVLSRLAGCADAASLDDLLRSVYDDVPPGLLPVAKHSLLAHLLKLQDDGRVRARHEDHWELLN